MGIQTNDALLANLADPMDDELLLSARKKKSGACKSPNRKKSSGTRPKSGKKRSGKKRSGGKKRVSPTKMK